MKKLIFVLLFASVAFYSCQEPPREDFTINGSIKGMTDSYIYFKWRGIDSSYIDSAKVSENKFSFSGKVSNPEMAMIYLKNYKGYVRFFLENAEIKIDAKADSLSDAIISGSQSQIEFETFKGSLKEIIESQKTLYEKYSEAKEDNDTIEIDLLDAKLKKLNEERITTTKDFINQNPKSFVSLTQLGGLAYNTPYGELKKIFNNLDETVKSSKPGEKFEKRLSAMEKTSLGKPAPAFSQNDVNGESVNLSDFEGKYVLVDFWASWCGPCRAENPNVVKAYNKYKDKGFTVLGVSLDEIEDNWKNAIEHDNLTWTQVSDLKGWKNEAAQQYGVRAIPANYLIDPEGTIIGHNLRGEDLENKLKELFD